MNIDAGVAHEDPRRVEVVRQEAETGADQRGRDQRRLGGRRVVPEQPQLVDGEDEDRQGGDRGDAGQQSVQAVDEVHRVGQHHGDQHGDQQALGLVQARPGCRPRPAAGSHSTCHCTPNSTSTPAARI